MMKMLIECQRRVSDALSNDWRCNVSKEILTRIKFREVVELKPARFAIEIKCGTRVYR